MIGQLLWMLYHLDQGMDVVQKNHPTKCLLFQALEGKKNVVGLFLHDLQNIIKFLSSDSLLRV